MDEMAKDMTEELTGKDYEPGDLSVELDKRIKNAVAKFCGKEEYEFGDLSREVASRVKVRTCVACETFFVCCAGLIIYFTLPY